MAGQHQLQQNQNGQIPPNSFKNRQNSIEGRLLHTITWVSTFFVLFDMIWFGLFTYWFGYLLFCFGFYILVCFSALICFLIILVFVTRISFFRPVLLVCHKISDQQDFFFFLPLKMKAKQTSTCCFCERLKAISFSFCYQSLFYDKIWTADWKLVFAFALGIWTKILSTTIQMPHLTWHEWTNIKKNYFK